MVQRLLRIGGPVLVVALGLVTPILVTAAPSPASADMVVEGCTIVSNPTPTNFTNCPGANFGGANLTSLNLSYANLAGAQFATCTNGVIGGAQGTCAVADLDFANLTHANLAGTSFVACAVLIFPAGICANSGFPGANLTQANLSSAILSTCQFIRLLSCSAASVSSATLTGADLSGADAFLNDFGGDQMGGANLAGANLGGADLTDANLTGANLHGTLFASTLPIANSPISATLTGANLTGTLLVPSNQTVTAANQAGAVVTWPTPESLPGATPGTCTPQSGSTFPVGATTVTCTVFDNQGDQATGTFTVTVHGAAEQLANLQQAVAGVGPGNVLSTTVAVARYLLAFNNVPATCFTLKVFVLEVDFLTFFKSVSPGTATQLIASAEHIESVLGC